MSPGFRIVPLGMPLAVKPGPETLMVSIVTAEFVLFVKLTETVLLSPRAMLPRLTLEVLGPNCPALDMSSFDAAVVVPEQPVWQIAPIPTPTNKTSLARFLAQKGRLLGEPLRFMPLSIEISRTRNYWPVEQSQSRSLPARKTS
jgi:hypothetical protein